MEVIWWKGQRAPLHLKEKLVKKKRGSESKNIAAGSEKLDQVLVISIKVEIRLTVWMQSDIVGGALLAGDNVFWQDEMSEVN